MIKPPPQIDEKLGRGLQLAMSHVRLQPLDRNDPWQFTAFAMGRAREANPLLAPTRTRRYSLHGLVVDEWTGYTRAAKMPFAELLVRHPGGGDELFAVAIARDETQRKLAEEILGSIRWQGDE